MKNLDSIILEIKQQIKTNITNSLCRFKGRDKKVVEFKSFTSNYFSFDKKFDLAEVPVSGPIAISVRFNALVLIDIDGNLKRQLYVDGNYGPVIISFGNSEYNINISAATISELTTE